LPAVELSNERIGLKAASLAALSTFLWGGNSVFIKLGLEDVPPVAMAGARFLVGALVIVVALRVSGVSARVPRSQWKGLCGLLVIFVAQILLLNYGTDYTTAGRSTVLMNSYPLFTAVFAHLFVRGDALTPSTVLGLTLAFGGVVLLFFDDLSFHIGAATVFGDLLVLGSAVLLGVRTIILKRLVHDLHPYQVLFWQATLSLPVFIALSLVLEREARFALTPNAVVAVLYQGLVVAGVCFILWTFLLQRHSASRVGVFGFITPLSGVLLSNLILGEKLSWEIVASVALVATGAVVVNRRV
jgi:drug/metabolite transporter (DMT)-like permease